MQARVMVEISCESEQDLINFLDAIVDIEVDIEVKITDLKAEMPTTTWNEVQLPTSIRRKIK